MSDPVQPRQPRAATAIARFNPAQSTISTKKRNQIARAAAAAAAAAAATTANSSSSNKRSSGERTSGRKRRGGTDEENDAAFDPKRVIKQEPSENTNRTSAPAEEEEEEEVEDDATNEDMESARDEPAEPTPPTDKPKAGRRGGRRGGRRSKRTTDDAATNTADATAAAEASAAAAAAAAEAEAAALAQAAAAQAAAAQAAAEAQLIPKLDAGRLAELLVNPLASVVVQLVELRRFSVDGKFEAVTGLMRDAIGDAFDVSLSDGHSILKCLLATAFNDPIRFGALKRYDIVRVRRVAFRFDELRVGGDRVVIIEELEILAHHDAAHGPPVLLRVADNEFERRPTVDELAPLRPRDFSAFEDKPMVGGRDYYLSVFDSSTPLGKQWRKYDIRADADFVVPPNQPKISEVLASVNANSKRAQAAGAPPSTLVGRVVQKSNIVIYGSPDKTDRYPMFFTFVVADATASAKVVCWTSTCFRYFHSVQVGDLVVLSNFRVQHSRVKQPLSADSPDALVGTSARLQLTVGRSALQLASNEVEIVINSANPEGRVRTLMPRQCGGLAIPPLVLNLVDTAGLDRMPQYGEFDACGVVVFVGRLELERPRVTDTGTYTYRWLQLRDLASPTPLCVRWACNGRADVLDSFRVGDCVALTDLKLMSLEPRGADGRHYAKATYYSQVIKSTRLKQLVVVQPAVGDLLTWATSIGALHWAGFAHRRPQHNSVFMRPPPGCLLEHFAAATGAELVPLRELDNVFQSLYMHEHRTLLVQGHITALKTAHKVINLLPPGADVAADGAGAAGGDAGKRMLLYDVEVDIIDLNFSHQTRLLIPESVYSDREGVGNDKANDFTSFVQGTVDMSPAELETLLRAGEQPPNAPLTPANVSRPLVFALEMCHEPRGPSVVIVALFDPAQQQV